MYLFREQNWNFINVGLNWVSLYCVHQKHKHQTSPGQSDMFFTEAAILHLKARWRCFVHLSKRGSFTGFVTHVEVTRHCLFHWLLLIYYTVIKMYKISINYQDYSYAFFLFVHIITFEFENQTCTTNKYI